MEKIYFEVGIRYTATKDNGSQVAAKELYIFKAETFSDAEQQAYKFAQDCQMKDCRVVSEKITNYNQILMYQGDSEGDDLIWYKVKTELSFVDNDLKLKEYTLVYADSVVSAKKKVEDFYLGKLWQKSCVRILSVQDTKIVDVNEDYGI